MHHDGKVFPAVTVDGEVVPEAYAHDTTKLPHCHAKMDDTFPRAIAAEEPGDWDDEEDDGPPEEEPPAPTFVAPAPRPRRAAFRPPLPRHTLPATFGNTRIKGFECDVRTKFGVYNLLTNRIEETAQTVLAEGSHTNRIPNYIILFAGTPREAVFRFPHHSMGPRMAFQGEKH